MATDNTDCRQTAPEYASRLLIPLLYIHYKLYTHLVRFYTASQTTVNFTSQKVSYFLFKIIHAPILNNERDISNKAALFRVLDLHSGEFG